MMLDHPVVTTRRGIINQLPAIIIIIIIIIIVAS